MPSAKPSDPTATRSDIDDAIRTLCESDGYHLWKVALVYLRGSEYGSLDEVFNEAAERVMNGSRKWFKERVSFKNFMIGVIRSLANANRQSPAVARTVYLDTLSTEGPDAISPAADVEISSMAIDESWAASEDTQDRERQARNDMQKITAFFADDPEVLHLIELLAGEVLPSEARKLAGATVCRRLRRGTEKLFPGRRNK